jgi:hypothetical protein
MIVHCHLNRRLALAALALVSGGEDTLPRAIRL